MRRWTLWGAMWLFATTGSVALSWLGVMVVAEEVTERPAAPLTERAVTRQATLPAALPVEPPPVAQAVGPGPAPAEGAPPQPPSETGWAVPAPGGGPGPRPGPAPANRPPTGNRPPPPPPQARDPGSGPPPPEEVPPAPPPKSKTLSSQGGKVSVRYEDGSVTLLWASPNAGFTMEIKTTGPGDVDVRFYSDSHRSRIKAWWDNGPRHLVQEFKA